MPGKSYLIELILRTVKQGTGGKDIAKEFEGVEASAKKASGGLMNLGQVLSAGAVAAGAVTTALFALKKAMDLGREGAAIEQTAESFDLLLQKVGASADLLDELRDASRGTISDMGLMTSTSTLLAGAQGQLATELANATPRLLEIAKAANKLNPSLGDTSFLYQSLATGIKRASPLILDNLGLTIKIGEANEKFAQQLGKTVEELSAEEQKMALLQATLQAGDVMIEQVGGSTESATDAFDQFRVSIENVTDAAKRDLSPAIAEVVTRINELIDSQNLDDMRTFESQIFETATAYRDYVKAVLDAMVADGQLSKEEATALQMHYAMGESLDQLSERFEGNLELARYFTDEVGLMTRAEWDAVRAAEDLDYAHENMRLGLTRVTTATEEQTEAIDDQAESLGLTQEQLAYYRDTLGYTESELKKVADNLNITGGEFDELAKQTGIAREELVRIHEEYGYGESELLDYAERLKDVRKHYQDLADTLAGGITGMRDLGATEAESAAEYEAALSSLGQKAQAVYSDIKLNFEESLPDPTSVRERMGMAEDAWDEWALRFQDIAQNGIASPWYALLDEMGLAKPPDIGIKEWAAQLVEGFYAGDLTGLINEDAQAWQDHAATMKQAQADATAAYNQEVATRKAAIAEETAALKAAREEQLAAEREARQRATLELSLQIAEQTKVLQAWSQQKFGPDFSSVADTADEVLGLIESGMITIDDTLAALIGNTAAGVQTALDMTGQAAEDNKAILDQVLSPEWAQAQQEKLQTALDLQAVLPPEDIEATMTTLQTGLDEAIADDPFGGLLTGWQTASGTIMDDVGTLTSDFDTFFADVSSASASVTGQMSSDMTTAADDMTSSVEDAASDSADALDEIIGVLDNIIGLLDDAEEGARQVAAANRIWKTTVYQLAAAYEELYNWMAACGAVASSPPMAAVAAGLVNDAYQELAFTVGTTLGQAFARLINYTNLEDLEDIEIPPWLERLDELGKVASGIDRIGNFFAKRVKESVDSLQDGMDTLQEDIDKTSERIEYLDWMLARPERYGQDVLNKALAERKMLTEQLTDLQDSYNEKQDQQLTLEKKLKALEHQQRNMELLEQQVKLLDLMSAYGLNAQKILGDVQLGVDIDPATMVDLMQKALAEINIGTLVKLSESGFQHGGQFMVQGPAGIDQVPVSFRATAGEVVTVTPQGMMPPSNPQPLEHHHYALTIHTNARAESALSDFHTMRQLAGV